MTYSFVIAQNPAFDFVRTPAYFIKITLRTNRRAINTYHPSNESTQQQQAFQSSVEGSPLPLSAGLGERFAQSPLSPPSDDSTVLTLLHPPRRPHQDQRYLSVTLAHSINSNSSEMVVSSTLTLSPRSLPKGGTLLRRARWPTGNLRSENHILSGEARPVHPSVTPWKTGRTCPGAGCRPGTPAGGSR